MRISFRRSGGITGMSQALDVSTDDLSPQAASELRRLVEESGVMAMPDIAPGAESVADAFAYTITVESGDRRTTLTTSDAAAPDALRPLLTWLNREARASRYRSEEE